MQLGQDDEIVVSDDGSTDETLSILESYGDKRIHIYHFKQTVGGKRPHYYATKNFENALRHAHGDYIFLADQDDEWMDGKVKKCVEELQKADLVLHEIALYDENMNPLGRNVWNGNFRRYNLLMIGIYYYGCAMAFRRSVLQYALPFPENLIIHDYWIGILTELKGKMTYLPQPLIKYRLRDDSTSKKHPQSLSYKISYRLQTIRNVVARLIGLG